MDKQEKEKKEEKQMVRRVTSLEILLTYHNNHLDKFLSRKINAILFSEMKPDDIVQTFIQQSGIPNVPGVERKVKAKERLTVETKQREDQRHILRIINRLIKEEENGKTDTF